MSSNTINILNSALQLNKKKLDLAMQNIANANNKDYSSKYFDTNALILGDKPAGVNINSVLHHRDNLLEKKFLQQKAEAKATSKISDFYQKVIDKLAKPGGTEGLNGKMTQFQTSLEALVIEASNPIRRNDFIDKANNLSSFIRNLSRDLQKERFECDQKIAFSLEEVNSILQEINGFNAKRLIITENSFDSCQLDDSLSASLSKLAQYFDISYTKDDRGRINVFLRNDGQEIVGKNIYSFEYDPMLSEEDFIFDRNLNPIIVQATSPDGLSKGRDIFINGGESGHVSYNLPGGSISADLEMRDKIIPEIIENLDELAKQLATNFNLIHNKGVGATALSKMTGNNLIKASDKMVGDGKILLNLMDLQGRPIEALSGVPASRIAPLSLDLSSLSAVPGSFNVQNLVDSINNHFQVAATGKRIAMEGLKSLNLAVKAGNLNKLDLDFDLTAYSSLVDLDKSIDFSFSNFTLEDSLGNDLTSTSISSSGSSDITVKNGDKIRSAQKGGISLSLNNLTEDDYPLTISFDLQTRVDGLENNATLTFVIPKPLPEELTKINGLNNKLFPVNTITSSDPDIKLLSDKSYSSDLVKARIVDKNGKVITDPNQEGYLEIEATDKKMTIALDQMDTRITSFDRASLRGGLSQAFGLNDFFIASDPSSKNFASFFAINPVIKDKPQAFAIGQMQEYRAGENNRNSPAMNFAMGSNDTSLAKEYLALQKKNLSFNATKNIDSKANNLSGYADEIISTYNLKAVQSNIIATNNNSSFETFDNDMKGLINVDSDNEALNILYYQKHFNLAAKFLNVHNELLQTLINAL